MRLGQKHIFSLPLPEIAEKAWKDKWRAVEETGVGEYFKKELRGRACGDVSISYIREKKKGIAQLSLFGKDLSRTISAGNISLFRPFSSEKVVLLSEVTYSVFVPRRPDFRYEEHTFLLVEKKRKRMLIPKKAHPLLILKGEKAHESPLH